MTFEQLIQAGFSAEEIKAYQDRLLSAGFSRQEIEAHMGRPPAPPADYLTGEPAPKGQGVDIVGGQEPVPFDMDSVVAEYELKYPEEQDRRKDLAQVAYSFVRPFASLGYTSAAALNRGMSVMATHLDTIADYIGEVTGAEKGGFFEKAAKQYEENREYWQKRANEVGVAFLEELTGEALGGAVPGITEFVLNIPYAGLLGAAEAHKKGNSELAGALTEGAKRGVLGLIFHAIMPLKQYLRAPAMGSVFGLQAAMEGGEARDIAKGVGTGFIYSAASPGGQMGLNQIRRNLEMEISRRRAESELRDEAAAAEEKAPEKGVATAKKYTPEELTDFSIRDYVLGDMINSVKSGEAGGFRQENIGEGWETKGIPSTYPDWFRELSRKHRLSRDQFLQLAKKIESGKPLTDRQRKIWKDVEDAAAKLEQSEQYMKISEEVMLAEQGFVPVKEKVIAGDLEIGSEVVIKGDVFKVVGMDAEGQVILQDSVTMKPDFFDPVRIEAVRMPGKEVSLSFAPEAGFRRKPEKEELVDRVYKRSDIVQLLTEKLDVPIRTGRFRKKALGIFKPKAEVIRTKFANDIETISHEIGHALQKFLFPETLTQKGLSSQPFSAYAEELVPIATTPGRGQEVIPEGFAEFIRLYVTNPVEAQAKAPRFYEHFDGLLKRRSPEAREILLEARRQFDKWLKQPALQRVLSQVSVGERERRDYTFDDLYTAMVDDLHPLKQVVDEMARGQKLRPSEDPYKLARLLRGFHGKAEAFLRHSPFDFHTYENKGKSLQAILKPLGDKLDEFRAYIVSRRALELHARKIETGVLPEDAQAVIQKYDKEFAQAFEDLKEYQDHCLKYLEASGVLDAEGIRKMRELNQDYVPLYRIMEPGKKGQGAGVGLEARDPIKRIKGSWRDIQDPLESVIKNTYLYINLAEKNAVGRALVKLAQSKEGMGKYVEKIPASMQKVTVNAEEMRKYFADLLDVELSPEVAEALGSLDIYRKSPFQPKDDVISVWTRGKQELYEVHPDIARAFKALDKEASHTLIRLLTYPSSWLRAGATLTPEFIGRNPLRDQFSAFVYSKYGFAPGIDLARGIFHLTGRDDMYWEWKKGGGDRSMLVSMDRDYLQNSLGDLLQKYPVRNLVRNPVEALRVLSELGEAGTRIGEFAKGMAKEGRGKEAVLSAAFASREVTLDFSRIGAKTKAVNQIIAFWNAQLQGMDKMVREFRENPLPTTARTMAAITLPSILLAIANHDDPRVKEVPQWEKDLFWLVPTENHVWRIPKPFEIGILFGSIPERITRFILDEMDPEAFSKLPDSVYRAAAPGMVPTAAIPIMENWANKSTFFDRPIVPQNRTELLPEYQYGPHTTETAKELGKILGRIPWMEEVMPTSPAYIENMVRGWTGGLGMYALKIADASLRAAGVIKRDFEPPASTLSDIPFIKAFHVRYPSAQAESIRTFYENYKRVDQTVKTAKALLNKENKPEEALRLLEGGNIENMKGIYDSLTNIHNMIDMIYINPQMRPEEKREFIDILYTQMIQIAQAGNQAFKLIERQREEMERARRTGIPAPGGEVTFDTAEKREAPRQLGAPVL